MTLKAFKLITSHYLISLNPKIFIKTIIKKQISYNNKNQEILYNRQVHAKLNSLLSAFKTLSILLIMDKNTYKS